PRSGREHAAGWPTGSYRFLTHCAWSHLVGCRSARKTAVIQTTRPAATTITIVTIPRPDVVTDITSAPWHYPVSKGYASERDAVARCLARHGLGSRDPYAGARRYGPTKGSSMKIGRLLVRLVVGGLFVGHGTQKLFGWFDGP